jgi:hypothetical protein
LPSRAVDQAVRTGGSIPEWIGAAALWWPGRLGPSAWYEHIPFAFWLIDALRPRRLVELGVHAGVSYCAFCQAIDRLGLSTQAYGIDHWHGDEHAGSFDESVFVELSAYHDPLYGRFSRLVRSDFDSAVSHFENGSIDLIHIDGLHTYSAVRHDFETWLPKLSEGAIVVLHDINVHEGTFGVTRLFAEVTQSRPSFAFEHGHGLGVVAVGPKVPESLMPLLNASADEIGQIRAVFARLGGGISQHRVAEEWRRQQAAADQLRQEVKARDQALADIHNHAKEEIAARDTQIRTLSEAVQRRDQSISALANEVKARDQALADIKGEVAERHTQIRTLSEAVQHRDQSISALTNEVKARDQALADIKGEVAERDAQIRTSGEAVQHRDQSISALTNEVKARDQALADIKGEVAERDAQSRALTEKLTTRIERYRESIAEFESALDGRRREIWELRGANDALTRAVSSSLPPDQLQGLSCYLDTDLTRPRNVGKGVGIHLKGWCYSPKGRISALTIIVDGQPRAVHYHSLPREDVLNNQYPRFDPRGQSLCSGFHAVVPFASPASPRTVVLGVSAKLESGEVLDRSLGEVAILPGHATPPASNCSWPGSTEPKVAICMTSFNPSPALFEAQIESIRQQSHRNWICVVSDDCSDAEFFDWLNKLVGSDARFLVHRNAERVGFYAILNRPSRSRRHMPISSRFLITTIFGIPTSSQP